MFKLVKKDEKSIPNPDISSCALFVCHNFSITGPFLRERPWRNLFRPACSEEIFLKTLILAFEFEVIVQILVHYFSIFEAAYTGDVDSMS